MRILAKDLKVGMTAKCGNVSMTVERVVTDTQINGKELTRAYGTTIEAVVKSKYGSRKVEKILDYEMVWKSETKI
jgi:hypothetical protein